MKAIGVSSLLAAAMVQATMVRPAVAQLPSPIIDDTPIKISAHVWCIKGFPNIGIVVGARGTLVVDTGLGPRNGATVAAVAARLSAKNARMFLTTTHFHPEHTAGEPGFPAATILIRNTVQQRELADHGKEMMDMFSSVSAQNKELLSGAVLRTPDVLFENEADIDLGGVTARLLWFGGAHTEGDELTFVEPDRTLISGDVVQNDTAPNIFRDGGSPASWLAVLRKVAALHAAMVLPDHSDPGDGSMVQAESALLTQIQSRALSLKAQGVSAEEAGARISAQLHTEHPNWAIRNQWSSMGIGDFVKRVYAEQK